MAIFISYSRNDVVFVDWLARQLVTRRHNVWMDRWELSIGDSLISKIQSALTDSDAMLIVLSKNSVASEWCKKELNSGLMRELEEKRVLVLPCVIDDCTIPLFLREKLYADFRKDQDEAFEQVDDALLRITNRQQGRLESPNFHTDWSYDWGQGRSSNLWYFEWTFVDHSAAIEYCILTECKLACNENSSKEFQDLSEDQRLDYIHRAFSFIVAETSKRKIKARLRDAFRQTALFEVIAGADGHAWLVEITSRRMGIDNGKDTMVHVDQLLERTLAQMATKAGRPQTGPSRGKK
jgi:hypothetical protein